MSIKRLFQRLFTHNFEDIERLVGAFPLALDEDIRKVAQILPFKEREIVAGRGTVKWVDNFISTIRPQELIVEVVGERLTIPYRVYFNEADLVLVERLSSVQRSILHCIYSRHYNGYIRQKHLESLIGISEDFVCPFVIQSLGEYVVEILEVLDRLLTTPVVDRYASFLSCNRFFWKQTQSRMVSYWDAYYRQDFPELNQYVGKRISDRLNAAIRRMNS